MDSSTPWAPSILASSSGLEIAFSAAAPEVAPWAGTMGTSPSLTGARASSGGAGWLSDGSTTRRPSVVFEEDDDLDVPDFLK